MGESGIGIMSEKDVRQQMRERNQCGLTAELKQSDDGSWEAHVIILGCDTKELAGKSALKMLQIIMKEMEESGVKSRGTVLMTQDNGEFDNG